tara:strand:+ start:6358 stop:6651 length:294 start_codon:yes stop_codon:yes gene_type:complete
MITAFVWIVVLGVFVAIAMRGISRERFPWQLACGLALILFAASLILLALRMFEPETTLFTVYWPPRNLLMYGAAFFLVWRMNHWRKEELTDGQSAGS